MSRPSRTRTPTRPHRRPRQRQGQAARSVTATSAILAGVWPTPPSRKHTIRIDSKLLAEAESDDDGQVETDGGRGAAPGRRRPSASRGEPGEHVRCVVSVSMLTEGWDANNVTHILGVRAFGSQLLCEQVVGRGLRRMNYDPDPTPGC